MVTIRKTNKDVAMTDSTLYDSYLSYFASAKILDRTPMTKDQFQKVWATLAETKRQFWGKRFRMGFDAVVESEAELYGDSLGSLVSSSKAA